MTSELLDVAIIGAGPIGIETAIALKAAGFRFRHFEAGSIGWTMSWWPPETVFFSSSDRISLAGVPLQNSRQSKASREEYLTYLRTVVEQFDLSIESYTKVADLTFRDGHWSLALAASTHGVGGPMEDRRHPTDAPTIRETVHAKKVILAIGDMHRPRLLGVPGEELPHVSHFMGEPHRYFGTNVLIVGGKNSAVEAAIRLVRIGATVTLCQRRAELDPKRIKAWLLPEIKSLIRTKKLAYLPKHCITEIRERSVLLTPADERGEACRDAPVSERAADFVLLLTGYEQDPILYEKAGVLLEGECRKPHFNPETMETNQPGLYVAGTGAAGTQLGGVTEFIETSHIHVKRILAHLQGKPPAPDEPLYEVSQREM